MKKTINIVYLLIYLINFPVQAQEPQLPQVCTGSKVRYGVSGSTQSVFNWEIQGGTIFQNYNDSVDVQWGTTATMGVLKVTEYTVTNCSGSPVYAYIIVNSTNSLSLSEPDAVCDGQSTEITSSGGDYVIYNWSTGQTTKDITVLSQGWYKLSATDSAGCVSTDSVYLTVNQLPGASLGSDTTVCSSSILLTAGDGSGSYYQWSTGAITSSIVVNDDGSTQVIWVQVTDDNGCINSDTIKILSCNTLQSDIPNAFTPNGDGDNDKWIVEKLASFSNARVEVFDRWGRLVFKSVDGMTDGWDGTSRGKSLPMDSYYYIINLNDGSEPLRGTVTIIR
jgi:gliding motility-associated-like protein